MTSLADTLRVRKCVLTIGGILVAALLSACARPAPPVAPPQPDPKIQHMYSGEQDGKIEIPAVDPKIIDPKFARQIVDFQTAEAPGTIVIDPYAHFLFLVMKDGKAMRYGVAVGAAGRAFSGEAVIRRKAVWPNWAPTKEMMQREPDLYRPYAAGMHGGLHNPLGARAMYLYQNGKDTLFRIHGAKSALSIGKSVSNGCIRLINQDVIDLYKRVPTGTHVVVLTEEQSMAQQSAQQSTGDASHG